MDQWLKIPSYQKRLENTLQHGELRACRCPGLVNQTFQLVHECILNIGTAGLNAVGHWETSCEIQKKEDTDPVQGRPLRDLPEWLEELSADRSLF